jgi:gliding motility-associated protein GldM
VQWANKIYQELDTHRDSSGREVPGEAAHFTSIVTEPEDIFPDNPDFAEQRAKTWEQFNFVGNPVVANLALLEKLKNDLNVVETDLLQKIRGKINNLVFKIDSLIAVIAPESEIVIAGMQYKTKLYVTVASTQMVPNFGPGVRAIDNGRAGEMTIPANGNVIPSGQQEGTQSFSTTISVPKADGSTQVIPVRGSFRVRKPEVVITSDQVQILYSQCANLLNVDVPALGNLYNPVIQARGGTAEVSPQNKKKVRVVPSGGPFELIVKQNTNGNILELDRIRYRVIPPPRPTLQFASGGQMLQSGNNIRPGSRVAIRAVPDASFAQALPNDARYSLGSCQVMLKRGLGSPQVLTTRQINGQQGEIQLAGVLSDARAGEQVILKLDRVARINFQNRPVPEQFDERELIISLTIAP